MKNIFPNNRKGQIVLTELSVSKRKAYDLINETAIRLFDILFSLILLVLALPVLVIIALVIKITSPGAVIYKQKRIGKNGRQFMLYKFRTMINDAEAETGPILASVADRRITAVGRFLRRTRIDEFPQLFNVIRGDMNLVGPRPERPCFIENYGNFLDIRLSVKPGLTGLAQVMNSYYCQPRNKRRYDYLYIKNRSIFLNLNILFKTIIVVLTKPGS